MRVKTGFTRKRRHKKVLKQTKGYVGSRGKIYRMAHEAYIRAGEHAFRGRKERKRQMRTLWIQRINAGLSTIENAKYNTFIKKLTDSKIDLNRKSLAELAARDIEGFKKVANKILK